MNPIYVAMKDLMAITIPSNISLTNVLLSNYIIAVNNHQNKRLNECKKSKTSKIYIFRYLMQNFKLETIHGR